MNKNTKIGIGIGILGLLCVFTLLSASAVVPAQTNEQTVNIPLPEQEPSGFSGVNVGYDGYVTVLKTEALTGKTTVVEDSKHNLITNIGINFIKAKLNGTDVTAANNLSSVSLSADSGAGIAATDAILASEITTNGLHRNGTAGWSLNGTGGFNLTATWTATASQSAASTGLQWSSTPNSGANLFAALAFTQQDLLINDQLQVIWQIVIS